MYINEAVGLGAERFPVYRRAWENEQGEPVRMVAKLPGRDYLVVCTRRTGVAPYVPSVADVSAGDWVVRMGEQTARQLMEAALPC